MQAVGPATAIDSMLYRDAFGTPAMQAIFANHVLITHYMAVKLAAAEARCGATSTEAADIFASKADPMTLDLDALRHQTGIETGFEDKQQ